MPKNKNFGNRVDRQSAEGYTSVDTNLPEARFSESKQVLNPDELGGAGKNPTPSVTGSTAKEAAVSLKSKMRVAPDSSVEILEGKQVGGVPLEGGVATMSVAGFSGQSAADDTSKVPYSGGNYRPDTRYGKKRSEDLFMLDNAISEQIVPAVEESKDLREAPEAKQGYNGRKQFKQTRAKKNFACLPQALLQESAAEIETHDFMLHTTGQVITGVDPQADYPTCDASGDAESFTPMHKSNYVLEGLKITSDGTRITGIKFLETEIPVSASPVDRDQANLNWQVDGNNVAKAMVRMQNELGRETTDKWSPLAYVIGQPYQFNMLLHDIEATTGAIMATAYRAAVSSMAFQRNIVRKDGVQPQAAGVRMFLEHVTGTLDQSDHFNSTAFADVAVFNRGLYRSGSAAGLIAMFDSTGKYRTKADLLGLQRSLPLHLSQADNNINPLHAKPDYLKILDKAHLFSTIDGRYNPLLPIHSTKEITLINPMSLNVFLSDWKHPSTLVESDMTMYRDADTGTRAPYVYAYSDIRNRYTTRVQHPVVDGLVRWLLKHEAAFVRTFFNGAAGAACFPATFDFMNPGLFEFMLCSASQDILWERNIIFRDVLFAGEQMTYIWDDLVGLKESDPLHSSQLTITKYDEPLKLGKMSKAMAIRTMWPEKYEMVFRAAENSSATISYMAPWHFSERAFSNNSALYTENEGFKREETAFNMTMPSIRDGVRHEYVDLLYDVTERDVRLALDRMVTIPRFTRFTQQGANVTGECNLLETVGTSEQINAGIKVAALRYDNNSDGRLIVQYTIDTDDAADALNLTEMAPLTVAKELGWIWDTPGAKSRMATNVTLSSNGIMYTSPRYTRVIGDNDATLFEANYTVPYRGATYLRGASSNTVSSYRVAQDAAHDGSIDRSAALTQKRWTAFADVALTAVNNVHARAIGMALSASYNDGNAETVNAMYNIDSVNAATGIRASNVQTFARSKWTMLQRYFRPINCFANAYASSVSTVDTVDPMEDAFYFGVCGTLASEYSQDVLERLDTFDQLNLDYTEDVFMKDSLLFRE